MPRLTLLAILLVFSAATSADDFSYNWLQVGYGTLDFDDIDLDGDGPGFGASFEVNDDFFIFGNYTTVELDFGIDATSTSAGVGYNTTVAEGADLFATVSYEYAEIDFPVLGSDDDSGFGFGVGMRYWVAPGFELNGGVNYVDIGNGGDTAFLFGALYSFVPAIAGGLGASFTDEAYSFSVFGRWYFGE